MSTLVTAAALIADPIILGAVVGMAWRRMRGGRVRGFVAVLAWLVFGAILIGRHRYGWRGRIALNGIVAGTVLLFLAYLGSKFVLEVILRR